MGWPGADQPVCRIRATLAALLVCLPAVLQPSLAAADSGVQVGQTLTDVTMRGLNGPARRLADFRGSRLLINVWASWCGPCRAEMASLERLAWREDVDVNIIGISTDDYAERAQAFLQASNATITHFIDYQLELEQILGASRLPLTVLVDPQGRVRAKVYGAREWDSPQAITLITESFALSD